jgi:CrcB protein
MKELIAVFIGSGLGGLSRFGLGKWVDSWHNHHFPFGTFVVNVVACFALGFVIGLADHRQILSPTARLFLAVGFCGGFSTFSTFSSETLTLFQQGHNLSLVLYILASILLCVTATFGGLFIAERI